MPQIETTLPQITTAQPQIKTPPPQIDTPLLQIETFNNNLCISLNKIYLIMPSLLFSSKVSNCQKLFSKSESERDKINNMLY